MPGRKMTIGELLQEVESAERGQAFPHEPYYEIPEIPLHLPCHAEEISYDEAERVRQRKYEEEQKEEARQKRERKRKRQERQEYLRARKEARRLEIEDRPRRWQQSSLIAKGWVFYDARKSWVFTTLREEDEK